MTALETALTKGHNFVMQAIRTRVFWNIALPTTIVASAIFAWELGILKEILPSPERIPPSSIEIGFAITMIILLGLNAGLLGWKQQHGTCPIGMKRATGTAGIIGAMAMLCPACIAVPFTILGMSISLAFLSPFLPLLRLLSLFLLLFSTWFLWPKRREVLTGS